MSKSPEAELYDTAMTAAAKAVYDIDPFVEVGGYVVPFEDAEDIQPTYYHAAVETAATAVHAYMAIVISGVRERGIGLSPIPADNGREE